MKKNIIIAVLLIMNLALIYKLNSIDDNLTKSVQLNFSITHSEFDESDFDDNILAILPEVSCITCLRDEIDLLNRVNSNNIDIYLYGQNEDFLRHLGALFDCKLITDSEQLFSNLVPDNPVVIKFKNSKIVAFHKAITGNKKASHDFYVKHGLLPPSNK